MSRRAILYARFSPRPNEDQSQSIAAQIDAMRRFCALEGYEIVGVFQDAAVSGGSDPNALTREDMERPGLWAAIDALRRGDTLLVHRPDRLARDSFVDEYVRRVVAKEGASVRSVEMDLGSTPEAAMIRKILAAYSEYERQMIAIRTKFAMQRRQARGERMSFRAPFGYEWDRDSALKLTRDAQKMLPSRLRPVESEQAILEQIRRGLVDEGLTAHAVAQRLNLQRVPARGERWHKSSISRIARRYGWAKPKEQAV